MLYCFLLLICSGVALSSQRHVPGRFPTVNHMPVRPDRSSQSVAKIRLEDVIGRSQIQFVLRNSVTPDKYMIETMTGGAAVFDYNNDGLLDMYFPNGARLPTMDKSDRDFYNPLYRNNGNGTFTEVTEQAAVRGIGYSFGVATGSPCTW